MVILTEGCGVTSNNSDTLIESAVYPDTDHSRYVFFIEAEGIPKDMTGEKIRTILQECLVEANPVVGYMIGRGICAPVDLKFCKPHAFSRFQETLREQGYSAGQVKPITVITNETQRRFFFDQAL